MFGSVIVTGARQVGKTTMLRQATADVAQYVTLDDPRMLQAARERRGTFIASYRPPLFIDEIQYSPELFRYIKMEIDGSGGRGLYYLSGSQQFGMMKNVSESLAGRAAVLTMYGLSMREICGVEFEKPFVPSEEYFSERRKHPESVDRGDVWRAIHRGSMPAMSANPEYDWDMYYSSYLRTYLERDVRSLSQVGDLNKFLTFMTATAARTGQLLNLAAVAREVGVSAPTAERWLSMLTASNVVYLLRPYHNNMLKRAVKTPKVYFADTGLAAYLTRWNTPQVMEYGAMAGAFFETFVISEVIKSYLNAGIADPPLYFCRDHDGVEIDLLVCDAGTLYPIEIKEHADPSGKDISSFSYIDRMPGVKRGPGGVVCLYDKIVPLGESDVTIPLGCI